MRSLLRRDTPRIILAAAILAVAATPAVPRDDVTTAAEQFYQERFCAGMDIEIRLGRQRRADCISQTHAIEIDWHDEWPEGIGRALVFSAETGLPPGIMLVCRSDQAHCVKASALARQTLSHHHVKGTLWDCLPVHKNLGECTRWDL